MGLRQLLKRTVKPLAMIGIAGTLSVSLIATTPSNAQAFLLPVLPGVWGATTMIIPQLMPVASVLGPIGWGALGVAALGVGLMSTQDYWLPYITGDFGKSAPSCDTGQFCGSGGSSTIPSPTASPSPSPSPSPPPTSTSMDTRTGADLSLSVAKVTVNGLVITGTFNWVSTGSTTGYTAIFQALASCRNINGGGQSYAVKSITQSQPNRTQVRQQDFTFQPCPAGTTMDGYMVGGGFPSMNPDGTSQMFTPNAYAPYDSNVFFSGNSPYTQPQGTHGPKNIMSYGKFAPADKDPRTDATKYTATVECVKPDGSFVEISAESTGGMGGVKIPSCGAAGLGHGTGKVRVDGFLDGSQQPTKLWDVPRANSDPAMPLCDAKRPGSGCKLGVSLDGKPCVMGNIECENWSDLRNDPNHSTRLSCQYGPYQVSMETCNPLERAYEPGGAPATEPNTDGNPGTRDDTQPDGSTQPKPSTDPNVSAPPGTGLVPGGAAPSAPPGSTTEQAQCFPNGWAMLNPIEWVMKPVGCALEAAFKPKKDLQSRLAGMQGQFSNKVPVSWFGVGVEGASGGACPADWAVTFDGHRYSLICGTEADNIIRGFRPVLGAMLVMAMLWPFIRSLFYAAIPVFKVNPS